MKAKDIKNIQQKSVDQLRKDVGARELELKTMHVESRVTRVRNTRAGKNIRREIAVMKTVLNQKVRMEGQKV